jgi:hypothetical protein
VVLDEGRLKATRFGWIGLSVRHPRAEKLRTGDDRLKQASEFLA